MQTPALRAAVADSRRSRTNLSNTTERAVEHKDDSRNGSVTVLAAFLMVPLFGFLAFSVDIGYIASEKAKLEATADACALATVRELPNQTQLATVAQQYATTNYPEGGSDLAVTTEGGNWDAGTRTFTPLGDLTNANAVRVTLLRRDLSLFFAPIIGTSEIDIGAVAIALRPTGGQGTRFLIDDEMIDSDIPAIEDLADSLGLSSDEIISDNDGDWFIDLPPGTILELPTGQVGDEALFDIEANEGTNLPKFPITADSNPSHEDFLNYNEDSSSWRYDLIDKDDLDPLPGVGRWNDSDRYQELVNPDFVHVSPVFKSDVSALDGVDDNVENGVNALGERRGLLAFKIIGVGDDPDGNGSELPYLIIQIVDPSEVDLSTVSPGAGGGGTSGGAKLVR